MSYGQRALDVMRDIPIENNIPSSDIDIGFRVYKTADLDEDLLSKKEMFEEGVVQGYLKCILDVMGVFEMYEDDLTYHRLFSKKPVKALLNALRDGYLFLMSYGAHQGIKYNGDKRNPKFKLIEQYKEEKRLAREKFNDYVISLIAHDINKDDEGKPNG